MTENKKYEFEITSEYEGKRADIVLTTLVGSVSRTRIQSLIERGKASLNANKLKDKKVKLTVGDIIEIDIEIETENSKPKAQNIPLDIVYEDGDVLVINKPAGMVVHPGAGSLDNTLVNALLYHCGDCLSDLNGDMRPGIVHRIDKDTSGILVVAKNNVAHEFLARQLEEHSVQREYEAIVYNNFSMDSGYIDEPLGRDRRNRLKRAVDSEGKRAYTSFEVVERFGKFTFVVCRLRTGRTHQIRVHMAHIKHPLLGDSTYGPAKNNLGARRQMLHARKLGFVHPTTRKYIEFNVKMPKDMQKVLEKLRKGY